VDYCWAKRLNKLPQISRSCGKARGVTRWKIKLSVVHRYTGICVCGFKWAAGRHRNVNVYP
jgi:hypothetical protein